MDLKEPVQIYRVNWKIIGKIKDLKIDKCEYLLIIIGYDQENESQSTKVPNIKAVISCWNDGTKKRPVFTDLHYPTSSKDRVNHESQNFTDIAHKRKLQNHRILTDYFQKLGYKSTYYRASINKESTDLKSMNEVYFCKNQLSFVKKIKEYVKKSILQSSIN